MPSKERLAYLRTLKEWCPVCRYLHRDDLHKRGLERRERDKARRRGNRKYLDKFNARRRERYWNEKGYREKRLGENRRDFAELPPPPEFYPYGTSSPLINAVIEAVTKNLPEDIRAETCQQMLLAILEGRLNLDDVSSRSEEFIKATYRMLYDGWKIRSIDGFVSQDGKERSVSEIVPDHKLLCEDCGAPTNFGDCSVCLIA